MNGTLAIWYEPAAARFGAPSIEPVSAHSGIEETLSSARPKLELHFNLWRDLPSRTNFLDIGLKLSDVNVISRIYIYFPVIVIKNQLQDLSEVMKFSQTLDAVFNSVVEKSSETDTYYTTTSKGKEFVTIHKMDISNDIDIEPVEDGIKGSGCTLIFNQRICQRLAAAPSGDQYLRFRLKLFGKSQELFTEEVVAKDKLFVSSAHKLELTELRLNEQRSFPASFAKSAQQNSFSISRVHYFLIRELGHTLVAQHAPLRKVRRLESKLWAAYLNGSPTIAADAAMKERLASRMVIYHWREGDGEHSIEDFTAFATFQTSMPGIFFYVCAIVLLGALGSTLSTWGVLQFGPFYLSILIASAIAILWALIWTGIWAWVGARLSHGLEHLARRAKK